MNSNINSCQRCGQDHIAVPFWPLSNPADCFTYWGLCPSTNEPVMLAVIEDEADWPECLLEHSLRSGEKKVEDCEK